MLINNNVNKFAALIAAFMLTTLPVIAQDVPYEVTVNEAFEDSTYEEGLILVVETKMLLFIVMNKINMELQVVL